MSIPFRDYHILSLLDAFEKSTLPIDLFVSIYFKENKALGSKDRAFISDTVYSLIRFQGLLNALNPLANSWKDRYSLFQTIAPIEERSFPDLPLHAQVSFPKNLFDLFVKNYGEERAIALCKVCNTRAPTTIRVNSLKTSRETLLSKWKSEFKINPCKTAPLGITFLEKIHFFSRPEFKEGLFEIQDEASQLVASLVLPAPCDLILDYCAGSGGKALAIAPLMQGKGQLFLHDIRWRALLEARQRLKRAGIQNYQLVDAGNQKKLRGLKKKMNWVLVDAPCSGSGTLRRNPDMKWRFQEENLLSLIGEQRTIFERALSFLAPGGTIVYATCSLLHEENEVQSEHFIKTYGLTQQQTFKSLPTLGGMDGFYAACFKKTS